MRHLKKLVKQQVEDGEILIFKVIFQCQKPIESVWFFFGFLKGAHLL